MMKTTVCALVMLGGMAGHSPAPTVATGGEPAPDFTLGDTRGVEHKLSDSQGKIVILEWINHDCPFVRKHYDTDNMQSMQRKYTEKGVVWFSVCSSAPGKQGHFSAGKWNELTEAKKAAPTAVLLDPDGTVGRMYQAKTTPQMYVIDAEGVLVYQGAIDDKRSTRKEDVPTARNYAAEALDALLGGTPIETSSTQPYGCTVKY